MRSYRNKRARRKRDTLYDALLVLALIGAFGIILFYRWFEAGAATLVHENKLPRAMENGVKHSYAASEVYTVLRHAGLPDGIAGTAVYRLGLLNERAEKLVKSPKDTTAESAKDMYNNYVGTLVAAWHWQHPDNTRAARLATIAAFAKEKIIAAKPEELNTGLDDTATADISQARDWLDAHKDAIGNATDAALEKKRAPISRGT